MGFTVGYIVYDSCRSFEVTTRISVLISTNEKVIGVSGVDHKEYMKRSADITASMGIPTFIYMFNDAEMMDEERYRTIFSMIETEETEAKITINFLNEMGYKYVDIWYHKFSEEMATYIYEDYVQSVGCGHLAEVSSPTDIPRIQEAFNKTSGNPSEVQLILSNSIRTTEKILTHMISELGFTKKIYVLGFSNGRKKYLDDWVSIVQSDKHSSIVVPLAPLLNTDLGMRRSRLTSNWTRSKDKIDELYKNVQLRDCPVTEANGVSLLACKWTSWLQYVVSGTEAILQSLYRTLNDDQDPSECPNKLRRKVFNSIVEENQTIVVTMNEDLDLNVTFQNKAVNIDYDFGVYRVETESYEIVGKIHENKIEITNPGALEALHYQQTCSSICNPGQFRQYIEGAAYLPCCWSCKQCSNHSITVGYNENRCSSCGPEETSNNNRTGCLTTMLHYITPSSTIFICAAPVICLCALAVIVISIVIFRNEERPIIKASDPGYLYMLLFGLLMGMGASFLPLLKPTLWTCSLEYILILICTTILTTNLLWKCIKIYGIFAAANSFRKPMCEGFFKTAGQTWLNIGTLAVVAVLVLLDFLTGNGLSWRYYESQITYHSQRYLVCQGSSDKSMVFTLLPLAVPTLYFITTLVLAFKMRRFPHNFRETLNIFGATLIVMLCCIMFLSGYNLSHLYLRAFLRSIVVFVTCFAFLFCLFVPRIILLLKKDPDIEAEKDEIKASVRRFSTRQPQKTRRKSTIDAPPLTQIDEM